MKANKTVLGLSVAFLVTGCGGSDDVHLPAPPITADFADQVISTTAPSEFDRVTGDPGKPVLTTIPVNGIPTSVAVPGAVSVGRLEPIDLLPLVFPINITPLDPSAKSTRGVDTPGEILRNGVDTGLRVIGGRIYGAAGAAYYVFPPTIISVVGPVIIGDPKGPHLTCREGVSFESNVYNVPTRLSYSLPSDGGLVAGSFVNFSVRSPFTSGESGGGVVLTWPTGEINGAIRTTTHTYELNDLQTSAPRIPAEGITSLRLYITR